MTSSYFRNLIASSHRQKLCAISPVYVSFLDSVCAHVPSETDSVCVCAVPVSVSQVSVAACVLASDSGSGFFLVLRFCFGTSLKTSS